jgi:hypothetical protein
VSFEENARLVGKILLIVGVGLRGHLMTALLAILDEMFFRTLNVRFCGY